MSGLLDTIINKVNKQNFGKNDSLIASSIRHPGTAAKKLYDWLEEQEKIAAGIKRYQSGDESDIYSYGPSKEAQLIAANNIAGMAQLGAMPFAPKSAGGTVGSIINYSGKISNKLPETQFSKAHEIAQRNASLPIEQGGLGLPPNNTAMDRARAMGFDVNKLLYHGRATNDILNNEIPSSNRGNSLGEIYLTDNPSVASSYAITTTPKNNKTNYKKALKQIENYSPNVSPLLMKHGYQIDDSYKLSDVLEPAPVSETLSQYDPNMEYAQFWDKNELNDAVNNFVENNFIPEYSGKSLPTSLKGLFGFIEEHPVYKKELKENFDSVKFMDQEAGGNTYVPFEKKNIRSRFAAFDPMKKDSANILATFLAGIGLSSQLPGETK
jgi:hypothetical protein